MQHWLTQLAKAGRRPIGQIARPRFRVKKDGADDRLHVPGNALPVVTKDGRHSPQVLRGWIAGDQMLYQSQRHKGRNIGMRHQHVQNGLQLGGRFPAGREHSPHDSFGIAVVGRRPLRRDQVFAVIGPVGTTGIPRSPLYRLPTGQGTRQVFHVLLGVGFLWFAIGVTHNGTVCAKLHNT